MKVEFYSSNNQNANNMPQQNGCLSFFGKVITMASAILLAAYLLPGVHLQNPFQAIFAALIIALINTFFRPILIILTLPFSIVTLGLFVFVINAGIVYVTSKIVPGFGIDNFWWAVLLALIISLVSYLLQRFERYLNRNNKKEPQSDYYQNDSDEDSFTEYEEIKEDESDEEQPK